MARLLAMTTIGRNEENTAKPFSVMPGLVPGIHASP